MAGPPPMIEQPNSDGGHPSDFRPHRPPFCIQLSQSLLATPLRYFSIPNSSTSKISAAFGPIR